MRIRIHTEAARIKARSKSTGFRLQSDRVLALETDTEADSQAASQHLDAIGDG